MKQQQFGVIGLGVMGQNLALNIERNGYSVAGFDLDAAKGEASHGQRSPEATWRRGDDRGVPRACWRRRGGSS